MNRPYTFYIDESGNRNPDKKPDASREGRDWFGFGGYLIRGEDNDAARRLVEDFASRWRLKQPCHMTDMLAERQGFSFLRKIAESERKRFWNEWEAVLCTANAIGLGCVVSRPGYVARGYLTKHPDKWLLCRSAFDIAVERAVKIAKIEKRRLHIVFEQDPAMNSTVTGYFDNLKQNGLAFDKTNSSRYAPLTKEDFANTLGRIEHKPKAFPLLQIADSYIYAMSRYKYDKKFGIYRSIRDAKRIADFCVPNAPHENMGVKYYCFDAETKKPSG